MGGKDERERERDREREIDRGEGIEDIIVFR